MIEKKLFGLLLIFSLLTISLSVTTFFEDAEAKKGSGVSARSYGSATKGTVCGDRLCSEVPPAKEQSAQEGTSKVETGEQYTGNVYFPTQEVEAPSYNDIPSTAMDYVGNSTLSAEFDPSSALRIARANVPVSIPLHQGYYEGDFVYFIITDSSDLNLSQLISHNQGWKVLFSPVLENATESSSKVYIFQNGVKGNGVLGFQNEIFTDTPIQSESYSALRSQYYVSWNNAYSPHTLVTEKQLLKAERDDMVSITHVPIVTNMPQIVWPGGQIPVKQDKSISDVMPFVGGQVVEINLEELYVTFIAHRSWAPDGRTIYFIVTDATPSSPAISMGVPHTPLSSKLISSPSATDFYHFHNGLAGSGPWGFQPGIIAAAPWDGTYSPMWRIHVITWKDSSQAALLQTMDDINAYKNAELIDTKLAIPMGLEHIINSPIVDPFQ